MERICEVLQCQPGDLFEYVSPEPGTEEAAELGAIVNREIEEPARKPNWRRFPHPGERGQLVSTTFRTSQDAPPGVLFMPAKHLRKVLPESCTPEKRISGKHTRARRPIFCSIEEIP